MKVISFNTNINILDIKTNVMCLGMFDGLHYGHMKIIKQAQRLKTQGNLKLSVLTLSESINDLFNKVDTKIVSNNQKILQFKKLNFDYYFEFKVTKESIKTNTKTFLDYIKFTLKATKIVVGFDFRFGHNASGNIEDIIKYFGKNNVFVINKQNYYSSKFSSSTIRQFLCDKRIIQANHLLMNPYSFEGIVVHGTKHGRIINFRTINLVVQLPLLIPMGVYCTKTIINNQNYYSISCYYKKENQPIIETYILNFNKNIYGKNVKIEFYYFIRNNISIKCIYELIPLIKQDLYETKQFFKLKIN